MNYYKQNKFSKVFRKIICLPFNPQKYEQKVQKQSFNPFWIKITFVLLLAIIAQYWNQFRALPTNYYSWTGCIWALSLYRTLNKDQISLVNQFYFSFYSRLAWGFIFSYITTGTIIPNLSLFTINIIESYLTTLLFTFISLNNLKKIWNLKIFRFSIFFLDQIIGAGLAIDAIFKKFVVQRQMLAYGLFLCIIKGCCRPMMQIITGYYNGNCTPQNKKKWLTICYLNTTRHWFLLIINYLLWQNKDLNQTNYAFGTLGQTLTYFNVCYGAMVGYFMYTQTYTL